MKIKKFVLIGTGCHEHDEGEILSSHDTIEEAKQAIIQYAIEPTIELWECSSDHKTHHIVLENGVAKAEPISILRWGNQDIVSGPVSKAFAIVEASRLNASKDFLKELVVSIEQEKKELVEYNEMSFRRGYLHGYSQAMDDMLQSSRKTVTAWEKVCNFFDGQLTAWRFKNNPGFDFPP